MKVIATIKNEKGEKQEFLGEDPSQAMRDLVQRTNLKGEFFFVNLVIERCLRRRERGIQSKRLDNEELPYAFQEMLEQAKHFGYFEILECLECELSLPVIFAVVEVTDDVF
jgi:hypothetical protein